MGTCRSDTCHQKRRWVETRHRRRYGDVQYKNKKDRSARLDFSERNEERKDAFNPEGSQETIFTISVRATLGFPTRTQSEEGHGVCGRKQEVAHCRSLSKLCAGAESAGICMVRSEAG